MKRQFSFSKYQQEVRPMLRENLNRAESTEDVKKFFVYAFRDLLNRVSEGTVTVEYEDILLDPLERDGFSIGDRLGATPDFISPWKNSDLPYIVKRMEESAIKRHKYLDRHRDKTETKMYPISG
jgi:hypothetical protein